MYIYSINRKRAKRTRPAATTARLVATAVGQSIIAACCSVLQRVAVCCSVLQCVAGCRSLLHIVLQCFAQYVEVSCSVLQCVAVRCSVL